MSLLQDRRVHQVSAEAPEQYAEESEPAAIQVEAQMCPEVLQAGHQHLFIKDRHHLQAQQEAPHTAVLPKETIPKADTTEEPTRPVQATKEAVHQVSAEAAHQPATAEAVRASQEAHLQEAAIAEVHPAAIDDKHKLL